VVILDNKPLSDFGIEIIEFGSTQMYPQTRDRTLEIPGAHGQLYYGSDLGAREFSHACGFINELSQQELQKRARDFIAFATDEHGRPRKIRFSYEFEPEKYYEVRIAGVHQLAKMWQLGYFDIKFIADDPAAYASLSAYDPTEAQPYDSGLVYNDYNADAITMDSGAVTMDSSLTFESGQAGALYYPNPDTLEWKFRRQYYGCHNYSPYNTRLVLTIEGKVSNPKITNQTTGETLAISVQLGANGRLTVDGYEETIDHPTATYEGDYIDLVPGHNSLLFEGVAPDATVRFDWKHKFV
jgi:hypothetical protein